MQKDKELCHKNKSSCSDLTKTNNYEVYEEFFTIGQKLKIKWTKDEIGDGGW